MKIAFLMDPLESMNLKKDTSYALMKAAIELDHEVFHFLLNDISLHGDKLFGRLCRLTGLNSEGRPQPSEATLVCLDDLDALWIRKDPPFDRRYFYTTLLLDFLDPKVFVINRASGLRDLNEKLAALHFVRHSPKSLISANTQEILEFVDTFERSVLKPLDGFGGKGIEFLDRRQPDLKERIEDLTKGSSRWIVANEFLEQAKLGDKRILLVGGEPIGAILRKADEGDLHNLDQGGRAYPIELTDKDKAVCADLKEFLVEHKLFFVGIDLLGDRLTEINVTSPTGLQELSRFSGRDWPSEIINRVSQLCDEGEHPFVAKEGVK